MRPRIHWYNRLAAWLHGVVCEPIMDLAVPVWCEEAEREIAEEYEAAERSRKLSRSLHLDTPESTDALPF